MASAKECDRCGSFYNNKSRIFDNYYSVTENTPLIYGKSVDLCPDCENKLSEWVNEFKRKENAQ